MIHFIRMEIQFSFLRIPIWLFVTKAESLMQERGILIIKHTSCCNENTLKEVVSADFNQGPVEVLIKIPPNQDGWIADLRSYVLLTVFQSYQDDVWMIMKGCVQ